MIFTELADSNTRLNMCLQLSADAVGHLGGGVHVPTSASSANQIVGLHVPTVCKEKIFRNLILRLN